MPKQSTDRYLLAVIIISIAFAIGWILYGNFLYTHYVSEYYDIGLEAYSTYWHLHPGNWNGILQFLVVSNHISPFRVLILPLFAIYQQPITLLVIQDFSIALTAIVVYVICRDLVKSQKIGLAMAMAFLLNPGTGGLLLFDFHSEAFMPLLYLLAFYFYMKNRNGYFLLSYVLLLCVTEEAPFVGVTLLLGLLTYELWYKRKKNISITRPSRLRIILVAFLLTFLSVIAYYAVAEALVSSYSNTPYSVLSPLLWYDNFLSLIGHVASTSIHNNVSSAGYAQYELGVLLFALILGSLILGLGFGFSSLANPVISIILYSPWLALVLILHDFDALIPYHQYFAFGIGGAVAASVIGFMIMSEGKGPNYLRNHYNPAKNQSFIVSQILGYSLTISAVIIFWVVIYTSLRIPNVNPSQLTQLLSTIPRNSSVMAQSNIAPHLFYIRNLELLTSNYSTNIQPYYLPIAAYWFVPDYIILDTDISYACLSCDTITIPSNALSPQLLNYTSKNYSLIYNKSGIMLFKRNGQ